MRQDEFDRQYLGTFKNNEIYTTLHELAQHDTYCAAALKHYYQERRGEDFDAMVASLIRALVCRNNELESRLLESRLMEALKRDVNAT